MVFPSPEMPIIHKLKRSSNFALILVLRTDYVYDKNGNLISITTPDGNTMVYTYDKLNRLIGTSAGGQDEMGTSVQIVTSKTLTWDGKDLTVTDARGNVTQYVYHARGMLIRQAQRLTYTIEQADSLRWYLRIIAIRSRQSRR